LKITQKFPRKKRAQTLIGGSLVLCFYDRKGEEQKWEGNAPSSGRGNEGSRSRENCLR